jgi:tellurite resistance protein TerC
VTTKRGWPAELARLTVRQARRLAILIIGATVLLAGVVMLVIPGPGIVVILLGLGLLALEFAWAARLLRRAKRMAGDVADRVRSSVSGRKGPS